MKKIKITIIVAISIIVTFVILHITPNLALRTHVFFNGYFIEAITTGIIDDEHHNKVDKEFLENQNAKCYTLTKPPIEEATQGILQNYKVAKKGFLYFASYYGNG